MSVCLIISWEINLLLTRDLLLHLLLPQSCVLEALLPLLSNLNFLNYLVSGNSDYNTSFLTTVCGQVLTLLCLLGTSLERCIRKKAVNWGEEEHRSWHQVLTARNISQGLAGRLLCFDFYMSTIFVWFS